MTAVNEQQAEGPTVHASADIDPSALLGNHVQVWHLAQVREDAVVGDDCHIGRGAYIGPGVRLGARCKVQNHALVYEPARLADGVFIGPAAVLTNDEFPRAITADGALKCADDWDQVGVTIDQGASIGARAVCVAPVSIGRWAMVAAGAVVTRDVPDHAVVVGVPARQVGWVGEAGRRLVPDPAPAYRSEDPTDGGSWTCPVTGHRYRECAAGLERVT